MRRSKLATLAFGSLRAPRRLRLALALALAVAGCRGPLAHTEADSPETCREIDTYASGCGAACTAAGGSKEDCRTECADVRIAVETCYDYCLADAQKPRACCERCVPTDPNHVPVPYPEPESLNL